MTDASTVRGAREAFRSRSRSAADLCREAIARIEASDPALHMFNTVVGDRALAQAQALDRAFERWRDPGRQDQL